VDLLGIKRKALGHCLLDNWGGSSSNDRSSSTSTSGSGEGSTGGGGGTGLGNISGSSNVSSYTYDSGNFVQDAVVAGTAPGADPNSTQASLAELSGVASSAPVSSSAPVGVASAPATSAWNVLSTILRGLFSLVGAASGGVGAIPHVVNLVDMGVSGKFKNISFGSPAPGTNVATGSGATAAASYFSGDTPGSRAGSGGSSFYSSPVIGYQGAVVNQPNSPALATTNLGATKAANSTLRMTPAGVSTTQQADTPWAAILVTVGLVALLS